MVRLSLALVVLLSGGCGDEAPLENTTEYPGPCSVRPVEPANLERTKSCDFDYDASDRLIELVYRSESSFGVREVTVDYEYGAGEIVWVRFTNYSDTQSGERVVESELDLGPDGPSYEREGTTTTYDADLVLRFQQDCEFAANPNLMEFALTRTSDSGVTEFTYTGLPRRSGVVTQTPVEDGAPGDPSSYTYDDEGRLTHFNNVGYQFLSYSYNDAGLLEHFKDIDGDNVTRDYEYDAAGNLVFRTEAPIPEIGGEGDLMVYDHSCW